MATSGSRSRGGHPSERTGLDVDVSFIPLRSRRRLRHRRLRRRRNQRQRGPKGEPVTYVSITIWLEKEFVGREPRRETLLSCSGNERAAMIQLNEPMPQRLYEEADVVYYVLGGEGHVMLDGKASRVLDLTLVSVPRGTPHSFEARHARCLLLAVLGGEPCEGRAVRSTGYRVRAARVGVEGVADEVRRLIGPQQQRREHERHRVAPIGRPRHAHRLLIGTTCQS